MAYTTLSTFLTALNTAYVSYLDKRSDVYKIQGYTNLMYDTIISTYLKEYIHGVNQYFSVDPTVDSNFIGDVEMEYMLSCANEIMRTSVTIGFDMDDYTPQDNMWNSIDRWYYDVQEL